MFGLHGIGLFSNSFIEAEREVISFLLTSALILYLIASYTIALSARLSRNKSKNRTLTANGFELLDRYQDVLKIGIVLLVIRFSPSIAGRHESAIDIESLEADAFPQPLFVRFAHSPRLFPISCAFSQALRK